MGALLAVDLSSVFHRAYHGSVRREEDALQAVRTTLQGIRKALREDHYDDLCIAIEGPGSLAGRRAKHPGYKAHRANPTEAFIAARALLFRVLTAAHWPLGGADGYEADDVLASLARRYPGLVTIMSGDRDMLAVCSDRVRVRVPGPDSRSRVCGPAECEAIMGVPPHLVCDLKALSGDPSDGIPGVTGIGVKTARAVLLAYGSIQAAYADRLLIHVPPRLRRRFLDGRPDAQLSWSLAAMDNRLPVDGCWAPVPTCFGDRPGDRVTRAGLGTFGDLIFVSPRQYGARPAA